MWITTEVIIHINSVLYIKMTTGDRETFTIARREKVYQLSPCHASCMTGADVSEWKILFLPSVNLHLALTVGYIDVTVGVEGDIVGRVTAVVTGAGHEREVGLVENDETGTTVSYIYIVGIDSETVSTVACSLLDAHIPTLELFLSLVGKTEGSNLCDVATIEGEMLHATLTETYIDVAAFDSHNVLTVDGREKHVIDYVGSEAILIVHVACSVNLKRSVGCIGGVVTVDESEHNDVLTIGSDVLAGACAIAEPRLEGCGSRGIECPRGKLGNRANLVLGVHEVSYIESLEAGYRSSLIVVAS